MGLSLEAIIRTEAWIRKRNKLANEIRKRGMMGKWVFCRHPDTGELVKCKVDLASGRLEIKSLTARERRKVEQGRNNSILYTEIPLK